MQLVRYATIDLTRPVPQDQPTLTYRATNGVEVAVLDVKGLPPSRGPEPAVPTARVVFPYEHDSLRLVVTATADGGTPTALAGRLVVPEAARRAAESAIQELADFLAVAHQCKRTLRSPQPALVLLPAEETERRAFAAFAGLAQPAAAGGAEARVFSAFDPDRLAMFTDRMEGLAMLADSLSEDTALGRVRELLRLFERAFRRGPADCIDPLTTLLSQAPRHDATQYSKEEVKAWFLVLRPRVVHGDRPANTARSPDVAQYLARVEYAAYDVLLNKATWGHPSATRRNAIALRSAPTADRSGVTVLEPGADIAVNWLDPYGVFPTDWLCRLSPPADAVWKLPGQ
jgi:hypothetical protein